ncbi:MAG: S-layer homology domain-containing protein, partial [Clostridia bacterium]|nr:S-layer homology domain-containing protein [Clostridia bacterium]
ETVAANCTRDGYDYYRCSVCGMSKTENITPHIEHIAGDMKEFEAPACDNYGTMAAHCTICRRIVDSYAIPKVEHTFKDEGEIIVAPTCGNDGSAKKHCTSCNKDYEVTIPADEDFHILHTETPIIETVDSATDWYGKVTGSCTVCGNIIEKNVDMYGYVDHFTDVKENSWFMSEVAFCVKQGYVSGMTETTFAPNNNLTRAQFLTLLAKLDGVDLTMYDTVESGFEDVKTNHWFNEVVCWAVENEFTSGLSETKFGPNNNITRAQLARFFYVYTEKKGFDVSVSADLSAFEDANKIQDWAVPSVKWAVAKGLITGTTATTLAPNATATRAQAARIIMMYSATNFMLAADLNPTA